MHKMNLLDIVEVHKSIVIVLVALRLVVSHSHGKSSS